MPRLKKKKRIPNFAVLSKGKPIFKSCSLPKNALGEAGFSHWERDSNLPQVHSSLSQTAKFFFFCTIINARISSNLENQKTLFVIFNWPDLKDLHFRLQTGCLSLFSLNLCLHSKRLSLFYYKLLWVLGFRLHSIPGIRLCSFKSDLFRSISRLSRHSW